MLRGRTCAPRGVARASWQIGRKCNLPEADDNAGREQLDLLFEIGSAVQQFGRRRFVARRHAAAGRGQVQILQPQAVISRRSILAWWKVPPGAAQERGNRPDASPVNCRPVRLEPWAPGARPTARMRARWSPKPGHGLAPVFPMPCTTVGGYGPRLLATHQGGGTCGRPRWSVEAFKIHKRHSTLSLRRYALNCLAYRRGHETVPEESGDRHRRRRDTRRDRHEGPEHAGGETGAPSA